MCDPISIAAASSAIGIASSVVQYTGQQQAAALNKKTANVQYANTFNAEQQKAGQTNVQQSEQDVTNAVEQAQAFGRIASAAATGAAGRGTLGAAITQAGVTSTRQFGITQQTGAAQRQQIGTELQGANLQRTSQINSMLPPSPASLILGIGGSLAGGASNYYAAGGKNLMGDVQGVFG